MILPILRQNNDRQLNAHMYAPTVTFARWRSVWEFATPDHGALRLQPTNRAVKLGRPVGRRYKQVLTQSGVFYARYARTKHSTVHTVLEPTHILLFATLGT